MITRYLVHTARELENENTECFNSYRRNRNEILNLEDNSNKTNALIQQSLLKAMDQYLKQSSTDLAISNNFTIFMLKDINQSYQSPNKSFALPLSISNNKSILLSEYENQQTMK